MIISHLATMACDTGQSCRRTMRLAPARRFGACAFVVLSLCLARTGAASCTNPDGSCTEWLEMEPGQSVLVHRTHALNAPAPELVRAVLVVHGTNTDADNYFSRMIRAADEEGVTAETLIAAPLFRNKDSGRDGELYWLNGSSSGHSWKQGDPSRTSGTDVSSFEVMDKLVSVVSDRERFPNLRVVVIAGHSAGAQYVQRYAAGTRVPETYPDQHIAFVVANPSSFLYLDTRRPVKGSVVNFAVPQTSCSYNRYKYGLESRNAYMSSVNAEGIREQYRSHVVTYLAGEDDTDVDDPNLDTSCAANWQGAHRLERAIAYSNYMERFYPAPNHRLVRVPGVGHSSTRMFRSAEGRASLFIEAPDEESRPEPPTDLSVVASLP